METISFIARKLCYAVPLMFGVTLISFVLMVYFGPDKTYDLLGKNPTKEEIAEVRHELGYDKPFLTRYGDYLKEIIKFDFGHSDSTGERVSSIFKKSVPVTVALAIPGFLFGNLIAIFLALFASYNRGKWQDKVIMVGSVVGMSISLLVVIIAFQVLFCSSYGLNLFPVQGWEVNSLWDYMKYVTVPTMSTVFVAVGYNTRFYRAVFVEEMTRDHVRTAKAYGCPPLRLLFKSILKNSMIPIITRVIFTLPFIIIGGSILIESYFGIPGVGLVTFDAITSGDQPILKAVVVMTAIMYVIVLTLTDILYKVVDPRISLA